MPLTHLITVAIAAPPAPGSSDVPGGRKEMVELPKARDFIEKSVSEETRRAYTRALLDFFSWVEKLPKMVTVQDVIAYRDRLIKKKKKPRTVTTRLSVVRAYFNYLKAVGEIALNPADARFVPPPQVPEDMAGRTLTPEEVTRLVNAPDRSRVDGARDHALLLVLARTSLRVSEVRSLRISSLARSEGRWTARVKVKGGRERTIPFPDDVKLAIDRYLDLDSGRRRNLHSDGDDAHIFQPLVNYRTLEFDRPLSARQICQIVNRWADFAGLNRTIEETPPAPSSRKGQRKQRRRLSPHDLRRTAVTRALNLGFTYRQVQNMTGHKDIRMVVRYDHERGSLEDNAINLLHYDQKPAGKTPAE